MKKILFAFLALALTVCAYSQTPNTKAPVDTVATETTPLLSYKDVQEIVDKVLGDVPMRYADPVRNALFGLIQQRAAEYAQKKKIQPKN